MGKRWQAERKRDHYYKSAKRENYRSRASYKLLQLNNRYRLIRKGYRVLDLGAAPGGWSQVALEKVGEEGLVVAVDLQRIKGFPVENFRAIMGDFTDPAIKERIIEELGGRADVVISDAAPSLSGIRDIDHLRSVDLVENVLDIAYRVLERKGNILIKAFQGPELDKVIKEMKKDFWKLKTTKPASSRKASAEMYIVGRDFKGKRKWKRIIH
ncbi:23S rRNA (uridine(2552)-2'-O)-methyltransferase [Methanothermobacter sp. KEPCO-1]|uniref:Ribosomal RNA large subunit methyltransferase E n=1 Tax=Methanothermobacter marburgensis (strain ATCC BAA-927 / DSM 2133 / JCM 14651 / NBRC 100331 / OCM 82 / Marburg) TaxID=79929 RepID=D9PUQ3_METTM|nr:MULTISPECIES: SAM-dependent methyltransferase [Methanothermobacter]ADL57950.1 predicted 23 S ribosomal RNA methyltransferase [Methanothermobacter marburgensis str. Marburg]QEF94183.1 23S rRNA (uridine(2552)-2'-O)-methyltransferase [Methanothermobacter sp. KEPCO-1]WBF10150.1 23S rRNA (uridine(2552)-2'-O)-methyltransferase [Methanothermobacter marburgensis]